LHFDTASSLKQQFAGRYVASNRTYYLDCEPTTLSFYSLAKRAKQVSNECQFL